MIGKFTMQLSCSLTKEIHNWLDPHPPCSFSHTNLTENQVISTQRGLWDQTPVVRNDIPAVDGFPVTYQTVWMQIP